MSKLTMRSVALPNFPGFYESDLSQAIDREEEQFIEYRCEENGETGPDYETNWPDQLSLANQLGEMIWRNTDHRKAKLSLARQWAAAFDYHAGEVLGLTTPDTRQRWTGEGMVSEPYARPSIGLVFEEMTSPREYNFTTDRLFAHIPLKVLRDLFKRSAADRHKTLAKAIEDRHSSYSGFVSFYSNDLREWLKKPLRDWDENELGTLLYASLKLAGAVMESREYYSGFFADVRETTIENEGASSAWESSVDWPAFDASRASARREKFAAWRATDPAAAEAWLSAMSPDFAAAFSQEGVSA